MIELLENIFMDILEEYPTRYIGGKIYIKLDENRRIELSFYNTLSSNSYNSIKLVLLHKETGQLHCRIVKFEDIFTCMQDLTHPNKIGKHIWKNNGRYSWYGKPTRQDIEALKDILITYIEIWE